MAPEDLFRRISSLLERAGIPYMLTGSFASSVYGMSRGSADIDFIIAADESRIRRLLTQLPENDFYSELNQAFGGLPAELHVQPYRLRHRSQD